MKTTVLRLYSLNYTEKRTYWFALLFVVGNIALPQLCHLIPDGGFMLLPIYFFTLIGAYKYGWTVGILTAILSPALNHVLFGMPPTEVLAIIIFKSFLLAIAAVVAASYFKRLSIPILALVVLAYQTIGLFVEWAIVKDFYAAAQDFRIGIPGMLLQVFGGYMMIKYLIRK